MNNPFFSVIIPTHNREKFLKIALESVLQQTFDNYELIIVDDGSTDNTRDMIEGRGTPVARLPSAARRRGLARLSAKPRAEGGWDEGRKPQIKYLYQENKGPAAARNRGVAESRGRYICFLDTDDRYRRDKLEVTCRYIKKYPQYYVFHTQELWYRQGALLSQKIYHKKPTGFVFENAVKLCSISISTAAIKKDIFETVGLFDEKLPACEDYDFWLRVTHQFPVLLIPECLTIKEGGHPDQQSARYPAMDTFRIYALNKILEAGVLNEAHYKIALGELKNKCEIFIKGASKRNRTKEIEEYKNLIAKFKEHTGNA